MACVLIPRFSLRVAGGDLREPCALAPPPGAPRVLGEVSGPAEALGVAAGMALGEALARCPELRLIAADPARAAELWERLLVRLEGVGAAVESERMGEAFFELDGLVGIHGGETAGVLAAARAAAGRAARLGAAPGRFASLSAAERGVPIVSPSELRTFLAPLPVGSLRGRLEEEGPRAARLLADLARLGLATLGELAALSRGQVADRFGAPGLRALALARGEDEPLRARAPREELDCELELPEAIAGELLERALVLLVERLLASPKRRGRTLLALRLSAPLEAGGSWSVEQGLGRPTASAEALRTVLTPRLAELPGPARALRLRALALGPPEAAQLELATAEAGRRRGRLAAAVREVRAAAGPEALLQVLDLDPGSRVPERRALLAPFPER